MSLRVPARPSRSQIVVLGSRFLAETTPVTFESEARGKREALAHEFPDATHQCWGLSLHTRARERALSSDAGEPAGTAGAPILQAIRRAGVTNVLVVVVRWFGGTKLGKGGLARAYREAARASLAAAGIAEVLPVVHLALSGPLATDGAVRHLIARRFGRVVRESYDAGRARFVVEAPEAESAALRGDLLALTRGAWTVAEAATGAATDGAADAGEDRGGR